VTETRRQALKMLGAIGATCAFPFAGDELYGQHVHTTLAQTPAPEPYAPAFFTSPEYATLSRLTDVIIPPTGTPGAAAAGVPEYIDRVVALNAEHQPLIRAGLAWLERQSKARFSREFLVLSEAEHVAILQPLSDEIDRQQRAAQRARFRPEGGQGKEVYYVALTDKDPPASAARVALETDSGMPVRFFRLIKNLTADGYYTSRAGLLEELGYTGNTALARFPVCSVPEQ
jgi:glucoside 3-dehydrogenase (cytochrome c) hitch-hiker subunit